MGHGTARHPRLALLAVTGVVLAGCGAETTDSASENTGAACEDIAAYADAVKNLAATLRPGATAEEVQAARDQAAAAHEELEDSLPDASAYRADDVGRGWDALVSEFKAVDDGASLSAAVDSLRAEAEAIVDATADVREDLDCG